MMIRNLSAICTLGALSLAFVGCDPGKSVDEPRAKASETAGTPGAILLNELEPSGEPIKEAPEDGDEVAVMETDEGRIVLMFHPEVAPNHVANFKQLAREGFYDGNRFHRVIQGIIIQTGDPNTKSMDLAEYWGSGDHVNDDGRLVQVVDEINDIKHVRGVLSMASFDKINTASSQFFIVHKDAAAFDGKYTAFGKVVEGLDVVDKIALTPVKDSNGTVFASLAKTLQKVTIETWPLDE